VTVDCARGFFQLCWKNPLLFCIIELMNIFGNKSLAIAVDVGGTNLRTAIVDRKGKIIAKISTKTVQRGKSGRVVANQIIGEIRKIVGGDNLKRYKGIGVSIAGPIDYERGVSVNPPNMNFSRVPITGPLEKAFRLPVSLSNDCNAAVLGEKYFGAGKKNDNLVYITMSSGIGGGAIVAGNLLLGKDGSAAEIGHMVVDTGYNLLCSCGKGHGHWVAYASGNNIPKFFWVWAREKKKKVGFNCRKAADIFAAVRKKDEVALDFMEELGKINGRGLSNVIAAYDPEMITFGGAVMLGNGDLVLKYAKRSIDKFLRWPRMRISPLGEDAPLLGAAALALGLSR